MELLVAALALVLGFLLGVGVGAARAFQLAASRRAAAGANAALARLWPETLPTRSAADMIAEVVRVRLGGEEYILPVLPRGPSRRWLETMDAKFHDLASALDDVADDTPQAIALLSAQADRLYDALTEYDTGAILPPKSEIDEYVTDMQILRAVVEVWRAANPLAATLAEMASDLTAGSSSEPPSSLPASSAGPIATSSTS